MGAINVPISYPPEPVNGFMVSGLLTPSGAAYTWPPELAEELDPDQFWRIHRGSIINVNRIAGVHRSFAGRYTVRLKELPETLTVSRSYGHLFKQM